MRTPIMTRAAATIAPTALAAPRRLEKQLQSFSALTKGACIRFTHAGRTHTLDVLELKPAAACSIVETDLVVDFAPPKDYVEPDYKAMAAARAGAAAGGAGAGAGAASASPKLGGVAAAGAGVAKGSPLVGGAPPPIRAGGGPSALSLDGGSAAAGAGEVAGGKTPFTPFTGAGYRLGSGAGGSAAATTAPADVGGTPGALRTVSAGGVLLASSRPASAKTRSLNKFELARQASAFAGEGRRLADGAVTPAATPTPTPGGGNVLGGGSAGAGAGSSLRTASSGGGAGGGR